MNCNQSLGATGSLPSTLLKKTGHRRLIAYQERVVPPPIAVVDLAAERDYHDDSSVSTQSTPYSQEYYSRRELMPTAAAAVKRKDKIADRFLASRRIHGVNVHSRRPPSPERRVHTPKPNVQRRKIVAEESLQFVRDEVRAAIIGSERDAPLLSLASSFEETRSLCSRDEEIKSAAISRRSADASMRRESTTREQQLDVASCQQHSRGDSKSRGSTLASGASQNHQALASPTSAASRWRDEESAAVNSFRTSETGVASQGREKENEASHSFSQRGNSAWSRRSAVSSGMLPLENDGKFENLSCRQEKNKSVDVHSSRRSTVYEASVAASRSTNMGDNDIEVASLCSRDNEIKSAASRKTARSMHRTLDKETSERDLSWIEEHIKSLARSRPSVTWSNDDLLKGTGKSFDTQPTNDVSFDDYLTTSSCSSISASLDPSGYSVTTGAAVPITYNTRPDSIRFNKVKSVLDRMRKPVIQGTAISSGVLLNPRMIPIVSASSVKVKQRSVAHDTNQRYDQVDGTTGVPVVSAADLKKSMLIQKSLMDGKDEVESANGLPVVAATSFHGANGNRDGQATEEERSDRCNWRTQNSDTEMERSNLLRNVQQEQSQCRDPPAKTACVQDAFLERKQARDPEEVTHEIQSSQRSVANSESTERIFSQHYSSLGPILCGPSASKANAMSKHPKVRPLPTIYD
jgi:hypothetical protein